MTVGNGVPDGTSSTRDSRAGDVIGVVLVLPVVLAVGLLAAAPIVGVALRLFRWAAGG